MSPFEHVAQVAPDIGEIGFIGNFRYPWLHYRKMLLNEAVFHAR